MFVTQRWLAANTRWHGVTSWPGRWAAGLARRLAGPARRAPGTRFECV